MAKNITSFSATHQPRRASKRRVFAENLLFNSLKERGAEMLDVLFKCAKEAEKEEVRLRAADRFLCHVLPQSKEEVELNDNSEAMAQLRSQLSAAEMARLNEMMKPAMQGLLNDLIAKVKEGEQEVQVIDLDSA